MLTLLFNEDVSEGTHQCSCLKGNLCAVRGFIFMRINDDDDDDDITDGTGLAEHRADGRASCVRVVTAAVESHVALLLNLDFGRHGDHSHDRLDRRCNQPCVDCMKRVRI